MIKIKLSEQVGKRRMSRRELAQLIGVRPNTICDISDILEFIRDEEVEP